MSPLCAIGLLVLTAANDRELENSIDIIHCAVMQNAMVVVYINYAIHETYFSKQVPPYTMTCI